MGTVSASDLGAAFVANALSWTLAGGNVTFSRGLTLAERKWLAAGGLAQFLSSSPEQWASLAALGTTQSGAAAIASGWQNVVVTTSASAYAAVLPSGTAGDAFTLYAAGPMPLALFPAAGQTIRAEAANAPLMVQPGTAVAVAWDASTATWQWGAVS